MFVVTKDTKSALIEFSREEIQEIMQALKEYNSDILNSFCDEGFELEEDY